MVDKKSKSDPAARQRILDAAAKLFHSRGYNATGINELIREAGVAKRSLYKHFESKETILKAYLESFQEKLHQATEEYLAKFDEPKHKILALFDFRARNQELYLFLGCPFTKINSEVGYDHAEINQIVQDNKKTFKSYILTLVQAANDQKKLSDEELTDLIFLLMDGALLNATIFKSSTEIRDAKALLEKLI